MVKIIKVAIVVGGGGVEASEIPGTISDSLEQRAVGSSSNKYQGLCYDIYRNIVDSNDFKEFLKKEDYKLEEHFIKIKSYQNLVDKVEVGGQRQGFDVAIGPLQYSSERMKKVDFTHIYTLSKDGILFLKDRKNWLKTLILNIKEIFINVLLNPLLVLTILGIILGIIFHQLQPYRKQFYNFKSLSQNYIRSIMSMISLLLGSKSLLSSSHELPLIGLVFVFLMVISALVFTFYLQASVFQKLRLIDDNDIFTMDNLKNITLLSPEGYIVAKNLERLGVKIIYKDMSMTELVEYYLNNPTDPDVKKSNGIATDYIDGLTRVSSHVNKDLHMSHLNYGYKELTFIINKNKKDVLQEFNKQIEKQIYNFNIRNICKAYFDPDESNLCVM